MPVFVSVLSDEPCWGQSQTADLTAIFAAVFQCSPTSRVGVNRNLAQPAGQPARFQCSPTSRVGVNVGLAGKDVASGDGFSALRRAVLGSIDPQQQSIQGSVSVSVLSDEPCWGQLTSSSPNHLPAPSFSALRRAVLGSIRGQPPAPAARRVFQCSPTSRVGVNWAAWGGCTDVVVVSVLSDEPCWGQFDCSARKASTTGCFSALRRAVLGSIKPAGAAVGAVDRFQCSPTSRVGVNHCLAPTTICTIEFQCSPTSRVGVNRM